MSIQYVALFFRSSAICRAFRPKNKSSPYFRLTKVFRQCKPPRSVQVRASATTLIFNVGNGGREPGTGSREPGTSGTESGEPRASANQNGGHGGCLVGE